MRRRIIVGVILILVLVAAGRLVRMRKAQLQSQRVSSVATVPVNTGRVSRGDFSGQRVCYGVISSEKQATVKARVGGEVSRILAWEGQQVAKGEALVELDGTADAPVAARAAVNTAIVNLERSVTGMLRTRTNLKATLDNDRMLFKNDAISAQQVESSENRYVEAGVQLAALRSELAAQKAQRDLFTIRAPFSGVIAGVQVQVGDLTAPQQPLVSLEDPSECKITAVVSADDIQRVRTGGLVTLVHQGREQSARIDRIHPSLNAHGTGSVDILLDETPFGLPLGSSLEVRMAVDSHASVLMVPNDSVLEGFRITRVHVVEKDTVRVVPVEVLAAGSDVMAVRGELTSGDTLVRGSDSLLMRMANGVHVTPRGETR